MAPRTENSTNGEQSVEHTQALHDYSKPVSIRKYQASICFHCNSLVLLEEKSIVPSSVCEDVISLRIRLFYVECEN